MGRAPKGVPLGHSKLLRRYSSDLSHKPKAAALWDKGTGLAGFTPGLGHEARLEAKRVVVALCLQVDFYSQSPILVTLYARKLRIFSFNALVRGCANTAFQHYGGVEVVSPKKSSESDEQLLFTRSKPKSRTLWDAKSIKIIYPPSIVSEVEAGFWNQDGAQRAQGLQHGFFEMQWNWVGRAEGGCTKIISNRSQNVTSLQKLEIGASHPCIALVFLCDRIIWYQRLRHYLSVYPSICLFLSIQPASRPSRHPCNACSSIQCNAGRFNSIRCASIRFNVFNNAMQILLHFISCHFNSIKCLHPTPGAKSIYKYTLARLSGPPVTSLAFPDASWALAQAPAKDGWSTDHESNWFALNKCSGFSWTTPCHYTGKLNGHNAFLSLQRCYELWNLM